MGTTIARLFETFAEAEKAETALKNVFSEKRLRSAVYHQLKCGTLFALRFIAGPPNIEEIPGSLFKKVGSI